MTEHEKVHVICENLCLEEGMTKEQILNELNTKASKEVVESLASGSPKGTYTDSAALKAANPDTGVYITTGNGHIYSWTKDSTGDPIDLGVYQAAEDSETVNKLEQSLKNLYVKTNIFDSELQNGFIYSDGRVTGTNHYCTDFIEINKTQNTFLKAFCTIYSSLSFVFYDKDKQVLSYVNGTNASEYNIVPNSFAQEISLKIPNNAKYFRFSIHSNSFGNNNIYYVFQNFGVIPEIIDKNYSLLNEKIDIKNEELYQHITDTYYLKDSDIIQDNVTYVNNQNSFSQLATDKLNCTNYIELNKVNINTIIKLKATITATSTIVFFDNEKNVTGYINGTNASEYNIEVKTEAQEVFIKVPDSSKFLRFSIHKGSYTKAEDFYVTTLNLEGVQKALNELEDRVSLIETEKISSLSGKNILVLGDSISDNTYKGYGNQIWKKWASYLAEKYHFNLTNDSIHATGYVCDQTTSDKSNSLVNRITKHTADKSYDMIILFIGVNDHRAPVPFGTESDTDKFTYEYPAMKYCLEYLINTFPKARIVALLPLSNEAWRMENFKTNLEGYINKMKEVYGHYFIPVLDLFHDGGFRGDNQKFKEQFSLIAGNEQFQVYDGLHPNEKWDHDYLAPLIKAFIEKFF